MDPVSSNVDAANALGGRFQELRGLLRAWFRKRVLDPTEAEDLTQESFLRIAQRGDQDDLEHFQGYLFRTAGSVLADRHRRRAVRQADSHVPLEPEHDPGEEADALRRLLAQEKLTRVREILMTMPERTRAIFILRRMDEMPYAEIAVRFAISTSAVQKHMARALEVLAHEFGDPA